MFCVALVWENPIISSLACRNSPCQSLDRRNLCVQILRPGDIVMAIPSDLMNETAWCTLKQGCWNWHSSTEGSSVPNSSTQSCLWANLPWAEAGSGARAVLCLPAVLSVCSWGAASYRAAHRGACCLPTNWGIVSSPLASAQAALPAFCISWATVFRSLWYLGSCVVHNNLILYLVWISGKRRSLRKMTTCHSTFFVEACLIFLPF